MSSFPHFEFFSVIRWGPSPLCNERPKQRHGEWTDRRTDGHADSMTDPAQRAESAKISSNIMFVKTFAQNNARPKGPTILAQEKPSNAQKNKLAPRRYLKKT